jgi:hypothetical protein
MALALAMVGGALLGVAPTAQAATTTCGNACVSLYSQMLGSGQVLANGPKEGFPPPGCNNSKPTCGDSVMLAQAGNGNANEDFFGNNEGTVAQFAQAGLLSDNLTLHYANDSVFEFEYAPDGMASGQCVGSYLGIVLQPCGTNDKTLFIVDSANAVNGFSDLISGTTTTFSNPMVLTVSTGGPRQLSLATLSQSGTTVSDTQMWADQVGVLP